MTEQRRRDQGRGRFDEQPARRRPDERPRDPGAYIGRMPERATEAVPGDRDGPPPGGSTPRGTTPRDAGSNR